MAYVFLPPLRFFGRKTPLCFFGRKTPLRFFGRKHPYFFAPLEKLFFVFHKINVDTPKR
jgi:hypothetical protein